MAYCSVCGEHDGLNNTCNYCGLKHCKAHTLPENHDCPGLRSDSRDGYKNAREERSEHPNTTDSTHSNPPKPRKSTPTKKTRDRKSKAKQAGGESETDSNAKGGDDSPPVVTKDPQSTVSSPSRQSDNHSPDTLERVLPSPLYAFFYKFGEVLTSGAYRTLGLAHLVVSFIFSKRGLAIILVLGLGVGVYSAAEGTGFELIDNSVDGAIETVGPIVANATDDSTTPAPGTEPSGGGSSGENPGPNSGAGSSTGQSGTPDEEEAERLIHQRINQVRDERGLSALDYDEGLEEIADYHSQDMLANEYFAHESPSGERMSDRYDRFGYECRVEVDGNRYATGGENIFRMSTSGSTNPESIADRAVTGWMNSPGHRENLLKNYWRNEGIGVKVGRSNGEVHVYATQNFC